MHNRDLAPNYITTKIEKRDIETNLRALAIEGVKLYFKTLNTFSTKIAAKKALDLFCTPQGKGVRNQRPSQLFATAKTEDIFVDGNNIRTYIFNEQAQKQVLLVHGWAGNAHNFKSLINTLINEGYKVITFDGPGHGASGGRRTNMLEFANVVHTLGKQHGKFEAFIGHSFGGGAILMAGQNYPELEVKKIITISSPNLLKKVLKNFVTFLELDPAIEAEMTKIFYKKFEVDVSSVSLEEMFQKINKKGLVIHDTQDRIVSHDAALEIIYANPNLEFLSTDELGHAKILRSVQVQQKIVDFLFD